MQLHSPALAAPLARIDYVMRAPGGATKPAVIDAFISDPAAATRVPGTFADAVQVARAAASVAAPDGMHRQAINQAHAVLQAGDGAWLVAPLVGDHRGAIGPIFIDGDFYRRTGLAVWGTRLAGGDALEAIVGVDMLLDLRNRRRIGAAIPIPSALT